MNKGKQKSPTMQRQRIRQINNAKANIQNFALRFYRHRIPLAKKGGRK